jgi:hypothetical protein
MFDETGWLADPYPAWAALREAAPLHWRDDLLGGAWLLTRHADVDAVLRDDRRFSARRTGAWVGQGAPLDGEARAFQALFARAMLFVDAPDHTRLRQVLNAGFRPALLQALAPRIEQCVQARLDAVEAAADESGADAGVAGAVVAGAVANDPGTFDFMAAVAGPLPAEVIALLMGIDTPDHARFAAWSEGLAAFIGAPRPTPALMQRAQRCLREMAAFFATLLQARQEAPGDGLLGLLLRAAQEGRVQAGPELLSQCAMLLFAGHETTRNLLGNGVCALLRHPAQWQRLQREPQRVPDAVRELLRYDSPVQYTARRVAQDLTLHGEPLRRGDLVVLHIGAANRDPRRHAEPDALDVTRRPGGHLSFGRGAHACIGAALSQMEAEAVLRQLLQRWPDLSLAGPPPRWNGNPVYRGLLDLKLRRGSGRMGAPATPPAP